MHTHLHAIDIILVDIPVATINDNIIYHPPVDFVMKDFIEHKNRNDSWSSPPFYTHDGGYLMCLSVNANGNGRYRNTHVSAFAHLMAGENEHGHSTVLLLSQY